MLSGIELRRSLMTSNNQEHSMALIDLTGDPKEEAAKFPSLSTYSKTNTPTRMLTTQLVDLSLDEDVEVFPNPSGRTLKRKASLKHDLSPEDHTPSKESKRRKPQYDFTRDDGPSPESMHDYVEASTSISEATKQLSRFRRLLRPRSSDDETVQAIDVITIPDDDSNAIDVYDLLSDDDEVVITCARRCLKEKKKRKVRSILDPSRQRINRVNVNGIAIENGCCVEFQDGTFMEVCTIYPEQNHNYLLIGKVFTRITEREILMPNQRDSQLEWKPTTAEICKLPRYLKGSELINEVCQRTKIAAGEAERDEGLWQRSAQEVKRLRTLVMTNQPCETNCVSRQHLFENALDEQVVEAQGVLRCRWKEVITNDEFGKVKEHRLERPRRDEVSNDLFTNEAYLSKAWRGASLNLAASKTKPTMAEACCGAGGMTLGAQMAGLDVRVAFDIGAEKIATHKLNFPACKSMRMDIFDWIQWAERQRLRVDVLHLSPPCQPFSAACTTPNIEKSEINEAVLLACGLVIKCVRPRVVTIEESDGLVNRHSKWFGALISQFTELGFSIRWACLKCSDFGVPQSRKRFILIASAPGEDLPKFPEPTHEPGTVSIQRTLDGLEAAHIASPLKYHDPASQKVLSGRTPYDANGLAKTMTCKGGDNYHPNGLRNFTVQEYMALQTFPHTFRFPETRRGRPFTRTEMKIQLGNAVPPLVGKAVLSSVVDSLMSSDRRRLESFGGSNENDAIAL